ncbi:MAG: IS21 family transposase [Clostridium sp.]|jgi:transposase
MIRSGLVNMIREKAMEGKSAYAISKEIGVAENTVKRYISRPVTQHGLQGRVKGSKLDPYKPQIDAMLQQGIFNCVVLLERLRKAGYKGGITILKEYVHPHRPPKSSPAVRRYETLPGKQAQMDWGICHYTDEDGNIHKVPAFVMVLSSSRVKYVEFTKRCDFYSLLRYIVHAFDSFGGVPETVLTDNMKTVIDGREAGKPLWNNRFEDFAAEMGFVPKVCRPRRPQTKGKVERLVDYVKGNFLPGRQFHDVNDLNRQALEWCHQVDSKMHNTTGQIPLMALSKEKLLPLPTSSIREKYKWETRKVSREGFVSFDGAKYGVPWQYSGREVRVRILNGIFEVYDGEIRIACHKAEYISGRIT